MAGRRVSFRGLPREIRGHVYGLALVSSSVIRVLSLRAIKGDHTHVDVDGNTIVTSGYTQFVPDPAATSRSLEGLALGLLRTSTPIGREAAETFYGRNRFAFRYQRDWSLIADWIRSIGKHNRNHLTHLEVDVRKLTPAYQHKDGSRELYQETIGYIEHDPTLHPRHPLLQCPNQDGVWPEGVVENIDPNMEAVFSALSDLDHDHGSKLTLHVRYLGDGYPGCFEDLQKHRYQLEDEYFSMDLPNLMEAWRAKHCSQVEVIWHLFSPIYGELDMFYTVRDALNENGFEILKTETVDDEDEDSAFLERERPEGALEVQMKRRALTGPIIQSEPNVYSEAADTEMD